MWFEFIRRRGGRIHGWGESAQEAMPGKVHLRLNTPTQKHRNPAVGHVAHWNHRDYGHMSDAGTLEERDSYVVGQGHRGQTGREINIKRSC